MAEYLSTNGGKFLRQQLIEEGKEKLGFLKQLKGYNYTVTLLGTGNFQYSGAIYNIRGWMKIPGHSKIVNNFDDLINYMAEIYKTKGFLSNKNIRVDVLQTYIDNIVGVDAWITGAFPDKMAFLTEIHEGLNYTEQGVIPRTILSVDYLELAGKEPLNYDLDFWVVQLYHEALVKGRKFSDILRDAVNTPDIDDIINKYLSKQFNDFNEDLVREIAEESQDPKRTLFQKCVEKIRQNLQGLIDYLGERIPKHQGFLYDVLLCTYIARKAKPIMNQLESILLHYIEIEESARKMERNNKLFGKEGDSSASPIWSVQEEIDKLLQSFSEWSEKSDHGGKVEQAQPAFGVVPASQPAPSPLPDTELREAMNLLRQAYGDWETVQASDDKDAIGPASDRINQEFDKLLEAIGRIAGFDPRTLNLNEVDQSKITPAIRGVLGEALKMLTAVQSGALQKTSLQSPDDEVMSKLEKILKKPIPEVKDVENVNVGYRTTGGQVTHLSLRDVELGSVIALLGQLVALKRLILNSKELSSLPGPQQELIKKWISGLESQGCRVSLML